MKNLKKDMMKNLSFPDFEVEKMDLSLQEKVLKVFIDGAWLDIDGGFAFGKGVLIFEAWESLSVNRFDSNTKSWFLLEKSSVESLMDLCEVKFFDSIVLLCGFGKQTGQWIEWKIVDAQMHAEFN